MKSRKDNQKNKRLYVRVDDEQLANLYMGFNLSTNRSLSEYLRAILLGKRIKVFRRSKELDDLMIVIIILRHELNALGNDYNQEVKKLHQLFEPREVQSWIRVTESTKKQISEKIDQLREVLEKIQDSWLS